MLTFEQKVEVAKLVLDYLRVLVWPALTLLVLMNFQGELVQLVSRMTKWSGPGFSAEFADKAKEMESEAELITDLVLDGGRFTDGWNESLLKAGLTAVPGAFNFERYQEIAKENPNLALAGLRTDLEVMLKNFATINNSASQTMSGSGRIILSLSKQGLLDESMTALAFEVNSLCNRAVHGEKIRVSDALSVLEAGERLLSYLFDKVISAIPNDG